MSGHCMSSKGLDGLMLFNQRGERFAKHLKMLEKAPAR